MADVFISYSKRDREFASKLAAGIASMGATVWWDRDIRHGKYFDRIIEEELQKATVAIVIWSIAGRESDWCRAEAASALDQNKLLPVSIQQAKPPMRFMHLHTGDLSTWTGDTSAEPFQLLCRDLREHGIELDQTATQLGSATDSDNSPEPFITPRAQLRIAVAMTGFAAILIAGAALAWLAWRSGPSAVALTTVLAVVGGISALAFSIMYRRFLEVLASGGARKGSPARAAYDELRESLSGENVGARYYIKLLRAFLDWIERFFGDVGMPDRTLFPHAFGLKNPAPLWTAPAFDRCLQLALIYPIVTIVLIWAIAGHVGPAEAALGLKPGTPGWLRAALVGLLIFLLLSIRQSLATKSWTNRMVWFAVAGAIYIGFYLAIGETVGIAAAIAVFIFVASAGARVGTGAGAGAGAASIVVAVADAVAKTVDGAVAVTIVVAGSIVITVAVAVAVARIANYAVERQRKGVFNAVYVTAMIALFTGLPTIISSSPDWGQVGPVLLFIGMLTFLNAPFGWISLGLTRALLRRGLELGGWWPYLFALMDAALAAVIITLLAATMVVGVQTFDAVAVHSGGKPVLPLRELFDGVATRPSEPEYWWLYALLLSSMIPSLLNLAIGGIAFLRGIPGLRSVLLGFLPAGKAVPPFDRAWITLVLTSQVFVGIALGVAAQAFLAIGIIGYVLPWFGLHILDVARDIADFNVPGQVWALIVGTLRP